MTPKKDVWNEESTGPMIICDGRGLVMSDVYAPQRVYFFGSSTGQYFW